MDDDVTAYTTSVTSDSTKHTHTHELRGLEVEPYLDMKQCTPDPSPGVEATLDPAPGNVLDPAEVVALGASDPVQQTPAPIDLGFFVRQFREQEYRAGRKGYFSNIPSWPTHLEHEVIVPEIPLHEFHMPEGRKCYAPIA